MFLVWDIFYLQVIYFPSFSRDANFVTWFDVVDMYKMFVCNPYQSDGQDSGWGMESLRYVMVCCNLLFCISAAEITQCVV